MPCMRYALIIITTLLLVVVVACSSSREKVVVAGVSCLFDEIDALLEVHAEVDELPLDAFLTVLLLLEHEHVVVEELLQTLVGVVDAQLLERVVLRSTHHSLTYGGRSKSLDRNLLNKNR